MSDESYRKRAENKINSKKLCRIREKVRLTGLGLPGGYERKPERNKGNGDTLLTERYARTLVV